MKFSDFMINPLLKHNVLIDGSLIDVDTIIYKEENEKNLSILLKFEDAEFKLFRYVDMESLTQDWDNINNALT